MPYEAEGLVLVKKGDAALRGRCDSFVVETAVRYPTDITLLWDALRKALTLIARWCEDAGLSDWRQYRHHLNTFKRQVRAAQTQKRRPAKAGGDAATDPLKRVHQTLLDSARLTDLQRLHRPCRAPNRPNRTARDSRRSHPA